jgi:nucleoside-diphosphate-sugar epimerase
LRRLLVTGFPGWLANALLDDVAERPLPEVNSIAALVHPSMLVGAPELLMRYKLEAIVVHDLGSVAPPKVEGFDCILHSAGLIHVRRTGDWYRINTEGTLALARAAKEGGTRRFVFVSSNAAGGKAPCRDRLLKETDPPKPLSHYGRSKWLAECGLMEMHEPGVFEVCILRPSMFYGPPVPDRHIDVYRRISGGRFPIFGDGVYARSITYIDSLVQATRLALLHPVASGQVYYIVDDQVYTTLAICEAMAQALGKGLRVMRIPAIAATAAFLGDRLLAAMGLYWQTLHLAGEANWHVGISCEKAKAELGYAPNVGLQEGMRRAVDWCRRHNKL